jgi:hypothetical protein
MTLTKKLKEQYNKETVQKLKSLIKDIREIPDGEVDRYLIIVEIKKIIKDIKK